MAGPDCPHGVDYIPESHERKAGRCIIDDKSCWNSTCRKGKWEKLDMKEVKFDKRET